MPGTSTPKAAGAAQPAASTTAAAQPAASTTAAAAGGAPKPADTLMQDIRSVRRLRRRVKGKPATSPSTPAQRGASSTQAAGGAPKPADTLMLDIRSLGRLPRRVKGTAEAIRAERNLADRMIRAKKSNIFSEAQLAELAAFEEAKPLGQDPPL